MASRQGGDVPFLFIAAEHGARLQWRCHSAVVRGGPPAAASPASLSASGSAWGRRPGWVQPGRQWDTVLTTTRRTGGGAGTAMPAPPERQRQRHEACASTLTGGLGFSGFMREMVGRMR